MFATYRLRPPIGRIPLLTNRRTFGRITTVAIGRGPFFLGGGGGGVLHSPPPPSIGIDRRRRAIRLKSTGFAGGPVCGLRVTSSLTTRLGCEWLVDTGVKERRPITDYVAVRSVPNRVKLGKNPVVFS